MRMMNELTNDRSFSDVVGVWRWNWRDVIPGRRFSLDGVLQESSFIILVDGRLPRGGRDGSRQRPGGVAIAGVMKRMMQILLRGRGVGGDGESFDGGNGGRVAGRRCS